MLLTAGLAAMLGSAAVSCGDDTEPTPPVGGASGGGSGGSGGAAGQAAGAAGAPAPVACGPAMCTPRPNPLTALLGGMGMGAAPAGIPTPVACCVDEANGVCGTAAMVGATCEVMATPDPRCPSLDLGAAAAGFGAALGGRGCCTPTNQCGVDGAIFGRGCVENGEARSMLAQIPFIGGLIMLPPPLACDRPQDDAGVDDAGL